MKFLSKYIFLVFSLLLFQLSAYASGGVSLGATRVIYSQNIKQASLPISNSSPSERFLLNSWVEDEHGGKSKKMIVTPPLFVSEPKSENTLRLVFTGQEMPTDKESIFWLNVKAIPSLDKDKMANQNVLQLAVLSRIKVFFRPTNLSSKPEESHNTLKFSIINNELVINNPSPYYVSIVNIKSGVKKLNNVMISPKSDGRLKIPSESMKNITFQTVNDYGAITPVQNAVIQ
jgi:fimbrial chaperone protein